jgi:hypothetical protein
VEKLLTRDQFREGVFERDSHLCVVCKRPAVDAHHILERRLFSDGGYYFSNGASLCAEHHIEAEKTIISPDDLRALIGLETFMIPDHFYGDINYDKWGNIMLPNGNRLRGELFYDDNVQKIIRDVIHLFLKWVKYPRTYHLPDSQMGKDDRQLQDDSNFIGRWVVATIKMDGENTTFYNDYIHARSLNSGSRSDRNWVKGLWGRISYLIDENMRVCGENLYAKHTIKYTDLESYFQVFSVWIDMECLSWKETVEYSKILGLSHVPVLYEGMYDRKKIHDLFKQYDKDFGAEGYVIRVADSFKYGDFRKSVGKYVKPEFRQAINDSHGHWVSKKIEPNELRK